MKYLNVQTLKTIVLLSTSLSRARKRIIEKIKCLTCDNEEI